MSLSVFQHLLASEQSPALFMKIFLIFMNKAG